MCGGGGGCQLLTKNIIGAVAYDYVCIPSMLLNTWHSLYREL